VCPGVIDWERVHYRADGAELRSFLQRTEFEKQGTGTPSSRRNAVWI
jgi:hypothetical protein